VSEVIETFSMLMMLRAVRLCVLCVSAVNVDKMQRDPLIFDSSSVSAFSAPLR